MPIEATAPARPHWAAADPHAPPALPGAVEAWLCALLTALLWRLEPIAHRIPRNGSSYPTQDLDENERRYIRAVIRAANRRRAWIGWILRFDPNRGMRRTFARLAPQAPLRPPRAPARLA